MTPEDYRRLFDSTYKECTKGNEIRPLPGQVERLQQRVLSLITSDTRTRSLTGVNKDTMVNVLLEQNIPANYICRRSYAQWDVLLPIPEEAVKLSRTYHQSRNIKLQPIYMNKRRANVSVLNVPCYMEAEQLGAILSQYGDVEEVTPVHGLRNIMTGDYKIHMVLDKTGFLESPPR